MDALERDKLLRDLETFGYQLARPSTTDAASLLARIVQTSDGRILEGFPVVLTQALRTDQNLGLESIEKALPGGLQRRFRTLVAITYHFLFWVSESDSTRELLLAYLTQREPSLADNVLDKLRSRNKIPIGGNISLDGQRLEKTYRNYVLQQIAETQDTVTKRLEQERSTMLNEAMRELFTDKQMDLVFKVLSRQELSKTDREYYSRVVKPRMKALRNPDLQTMAATLLGF